MMRSSLVPRLALSTVIIALAAIALTLWLVRCGLDGLVGPSRDKTA